jgi:LPXTG-motif cell wall-anchored protein
MSEREAQYVVLDEKEDFSLTAHIDSDGLQRIVVEGYLERRRPDGVYHTALIPDLFYGADGTQLQGSWSQNLTAGDHVVLRRDSGNPRVPDDELNWHKVSTEQRPQRPTTPTAPTQTVSTLAVDTNTIIMVAVGGIIALAALYLLFRKKR